jgi:hypothetical protein
MFSDAKKHTIGRIRSAELRTAPFPHIFVEDIFPRDFYAEMLRHRLPAESYRPLVETGRVMREYSPERLCYMPADGSADVPSASSAFWQSVFATYNDAEFFQVWMDLFLSHLAERIVQQFGSAADQLKAHAEMFLMRDKTNYVLNPHTDSPKKAISALFYLPPDGRFEKLGTSLYRPKEGAIVPFGMHYADRAQFDLNTTIPFRANAMFAFPNVPGSIHGVEPMASPDDVRDLMLYDIRFNPVAPTA